MKTMKLITTTIVSILLLGCKGSDEKSKSSSFSTENQKIETFDHGIKTKISTLEIPYNWSLIHDVATNPESGYPDRYKNILVGPQNQYRRAYLSWFLYGNINRVPYNQALNKTLSHVTSPEKLSKLNYEQGTRSPLENLPSFKQKQTRLAAMRAKAQVYEVEFTAQKEGRSYKGKITLLNQYTQDGSGFLQPLNMVFSPAEHYESTISTLAKIDKTVVYDPAYHTKMKAITSRNMKRSAEYSRKMMSQSATAHQRRMADSKAAFASHQKNMAGLNQIQDVAHANFLKKLRSSGNFASVNAKGHATHDKLIDQTHERSTFRDPWTKKDINLHGQFKYNFTNGLGDFYRTDDPSFDPHSLKGNWTPIPTRN